MLVIFFTFIHANLVVCKEAKKGVDEHVHWSLISISVNILFALKFVDYVLDVRICVIILSWVIPNITHRTPVCSGAAS